MNQPIRALGLLLMLCSGWAHAQFNPFQALQALERRIVGGVAGAERKVQHDVTVVVQAAAPEFAPIAACLNSAIQGGIPVGRPPAAALTGHPQEFISALVKEVTYVLRTGFPQIMQSQIAWLREGFQSNPGHGDFIRESIDSWKRMAAMHPRGRCLVPLIDKSRPALEAVAAELAGELETDARQLYDDHVKPAVHQAIGQGISKVITGNSADGLLLTERELADVVSGVYTRYLVGQLQDGAGVVKDFRSTLGKPAPSADPLPRLVKTLSPDAQWPETFRLDLGVEIVRAMGHKYIDSNKPGHGGFLVNQAVGIFQLSEGTIEKLVEGICGLIPEAGAAICAVAEVAVDAAWNQGIVPTMRWGIKTGLHDLLDAEITQARTALANNQALTQAANSSSPFNGITTLLSKDLVNSVADKHLKDVRVALNGFNASVTGLATAADGLGRKR